MIRAILVVLLIFVSSCAPQNPVATTTPASINLTLAKALNDAQASIESAKSLLPSVPAIKDPLNKIIASYNAVETAYLAYHSVVSSGGTPDATALQAQVTQLTVDIAALIKEFKK